MDAHIIVFAAVAQQKNSTKSIYKEPSKIRPPTLDKRAAWASRQAAEAK